jgi:NADH-quinone oxidoreductase subunit B
MTGHFITTRIEDACHWARGYSLWPMPFGTACCALEFMSTVTSRFDLSRFGAEIVRFSPRQSDLLLVMGTITLKQAPILKRIYEQMPEPKWVVAYGACAGSGGFYNNYNTVQGIDGIIPVNVYVPGCPPRPEQLFEAILEIQTNHPGRRENA